MAPGFDWRSLTSLASNFAGDQGGRVHLCDRRRRERHRVEGQEDLLGRTPGEALWPERFNEEELAGKKKAVSPYWWSAEYQQRPTPREGTLFQRDWFGEPITDYPTDVTLVRYWDPAATKEGDYTAGALVAEKDGIYYIVDMQRVRTRPAGVEQLIRQTAERDRERGDVAIFMEQEPGSSGVSMIDNYARRAIV